MTWHIKWSRTVETSHWTPNTYKHILNIYFHLKKEGTLSSSLVLFLISPHKEHLTLHLVQQLLRNRNVTSVNGDVNGLALHFIQRASFNYSHPFTQARFSIVKCFQEQLASRKLPKEVWHADRSSQGLNRLLVDDMLYHLNCSRPSAMVVAPFLKISMHGGSWCTDTSLNPLLMKLFQVLHFTCLDNPLILVACVPFSTTPIYLSASLF